MSSLSLNNLSDLCELGEAPGKYRIGLLALVNDYVVERDMMTMRPKDDELTIFTNRVPFEGDCSPDNLAAMATRLSDATDMILPGGRLDAVIYSCTAGTATIGYDKVAASIHAVRPEAQCITPVTAAHAAFKALGLSKIAVLAPYTSEVSKTTVAALQDCGVEVIKTSIFDIIVSDDISSVTPEAIYQGALAADCEEADGLFISCTDFQSVSVIEKIENALGKPVVTANQATFWQAMRSSGYEASVKGYGKLLTL